MIPFLCRYNTKTHNYAMSNEVRRISSRKKIYEEFHTKIPFSLDSHTISIISFELKKRKCKKGEGKRKSISKDCYYLFGTIINGFIMILIFLLFIYLFWFRLLLIMALDFILVLFIRLNKRKIEWMLPSNWTSKLFISNGASYVMNLWSLLNICCHHHLWSASSFCRRPHNHYIVRLMLNKMSESKNAKWKTKEHFIIFQNFNKTT